MTLLPPVSLGQILTGALFNEHFKIRPPGGAPDPSACNPQFCVYDDLHKDYCYQAAWVAFLAQKLCDLALYENIIAKRKATAKPVEARSATA